MKCCSLLLHCGQANDRKSWPHMLGSIAVNLMGEPQAAHSGPWFCLSSIATPYVWREAVSWDRCQTGARNPERIHFIERVSVTTLST